MDGIASGVAESGLPKGFFESQLRVSVRFDPPKPRFGVNLEGDPGFWPKDSGRARLSRFNSEYTYGIPIKTGNVDETLDGILKPTSEWKTQIML